MVCTRIIIRLSEYSPLCNFSLINSRRKNLISDLLILCSYCILTIFLTLKLAHVKFCDSRLVMTVTGRLFLTIRIINTIPNRIPSSETFLPSITAVSCSNWLARVCRVAGDTSSDRCAIRDSTCCIDMLASHF
jgi:hypothetical protein